MRRPIITLLAAVALVGVSLAATPADTYVVQQFGEIVSLDPARAYDTSSGAILENIYETLYQYDGESITTFVPALATSHQILDDGLRFRFTLRPNVQFHSGNTMACRDVAWSMKNAMLTAHPQGGTSYLMGKPFLGTQTTGADPAQFLSEVTWDMIDGIATCPEGPDGLVVDLHFTLPDPAIMSILVYTAFSVVDSQWAIANGMWDGTKATWESWIGRDLTQEFMHRNTSGTGAYKTVEWGDRVYVAERFDGYWGGPAPLKNVVFQYVNEEATRILALQQGDADRVQINARATLVQVRGVPGVKIFENPAWSSLVVTNIFFNFDINTEDNEDAGSGRLDGSGIPPQFFQDVDIRRAFTHLFDPVEFNEQVFQGTGVILTMPMPPSFPGYNAAAPVRVLDLEAAEEAFRRAWGGAVWEQGFSFTALYNAGNVAREAALNLIKENLEFINPKFRMNVRSLPWPDYLARTSTKKMPMFALGWAPDYADARNFINTFYSDSGFYAPRTSISVPPIQTIIDEANTILDPDTRSFLYRAVGNLHYDLAPLINIPSPSIFIPGRDNLQGVFFNPMLSHYYRWKDVSKN
jgi:peptide/nickel transport system substrate-binding protein